MQIAGVGFWEPSAESVLLLCVTQAAEFGAPAVEFGDRTRWI
jgi:hypothetical protein